MTLKRKVLVMDIPESQPVVELMTVTPEIAAAWLEHNHDNRSVRKNVVETYARDMRAGNWKVTGDTIKRNGAKILDGQHRLLACVAANTSFVTAVATGVPDHAHHAIDTGIKRSIADELRWNGASDCVSVGSILNLVWRIDNEAMFRFDRGSTAEIVAMYRRNPDLAQHAAVLARRAFRAARVPVSPSGAIVYQLGRNNQHDLAEEWTQYLSDGTGYTEGDPALTLRNYAIRAYNSPTIRPTQETWLAIITKAFNAWTDGKPVSQLSWRKVGRGKEPFPTINTAEEGAVT